MTELNENMFRSLYFCSFFVFSLVGTSNESLLRNRMLSYLQEAEKSMEKGRGDSSKETAIIMELLMKEPVKITVHGHIKFAQETSLPLKRPKTSLLRVILAPFASDLREVDESRTDYKGYHTKGSYVDWSAHYQRGKPLKYTIDVTIPREWLQKGVTYHIFAILNKGWTPADTQGEKPREGDYVAAGLFSLQDELNNYTKDLRLKKYHPSGHSHKHQGLHHLDEVAPPVGLELNTQKSSVPKYFM